MKRKKDKVSFGEGREGDEEKEGECGPQAAERGPQAAERGPQAVEGGPQAAERGPQVGEGGPQVGASRQVGDGEAGGPQEAPWGFAAPWLSVCRAFFAALW